MRLPCPPYFQETGGPHRFSGRGLFLRGGAFSLDSRYAKQVVFIGMEIHYSGKPLVLENVVFINCWFVFDNNERGWKFARQLLDRPLISWSA